MGPARREARIRGSSPDTVQPCRSPRLDGGHPGGRGAFWFGDGADPFVRGPEAVRLSVGDELDEIAPPTESREHRRGTAA